METSVQVGNLLKKYFWEMADDVSLSTGNQMVLPEEAADFIEEYAEKFGVDMTHFEFRKYFPNEGVRFLPNTILPKFMRTDHHEPAPLTVRMLIESAEAGRWLFP
ncbi:DUF1493 domain-containing protein [Pantoea ananatis]|uniref:DUF1493 family protein n=1 Tax=Pantoea ananas TaxID=553 RepID=UPI00051D2C12|nr:DUF1493 family protein [Pantoea ananatis]AWQ17485.1 DUF1493 domain-containing protein [Pantoea ananatis]KGL53012.1 hypothetical protein KR94_16430 [Pantoea ananatis]MBN6032971.1 DUF1493 family protein [Pantoea ananatis]